MKESNKMISLLVRRAIIYVAFLKIDDDANNIPRSIQLSRENETIGIF